ncbi:hypothetical protein Tsubulata_027034 [Turnera subulata]|uniref:RRP15-like protein n=1 Tax=Turnera subulata TaxID=218843 RepID=A0A9Q0FI34_9ROSI|nr:hypothetical protein Tsubulata_027034 [Turnera subulata]
MAEETHIAEPVKPSRKRKTGRSKGGKAKKHKQLLGIQAKPKKIDPKLKKFLRKKARDYNSDSDKEDGDAAHGLGGKDNVSMSGSDDNGYANDGDEGGDVRKKDLGVEIDASEDEGAEIVPGVTKFSEGVRAFSVAVRSILNTKLPDDALGPVLAFHKKLLAEKLGEEEDEKKVKRQAKKEKRVTAEKGHVKPATYLDAHEKLLISIATKGVVKLFNAVNKAKTAQKGLDPSRSKDAKAIKKRRKEAFFSELGKTPAADASAKVNTSAGEGPSWAPLRDNYMLTSSKLKDWDKMADTAVADDTGGFSEDSSSDED